MNLSKLKIRHTEMSLFKYSQWLQKNQNLDTLGEGMFGIVFQHPKYKDVVVKVASLSYGKTPGDDAYLNFVKIALDHQHNPFFPKIYDVQLYRGDNHLFSITFMEKLESWDDANRRTVQAPILKKLGIDDVDAIDNRECYNQKKRSKNKHFQQMLKVMQPLFKNHGNDMHDGNVMLRRSKKSKELQLVITDPVA